MSLSFYLPFNLLRRVTRHSFLFGRFLPLSGEVGSSDEFWISALPPNEFVSLWAGRKLAEEQRWLRALPSAREEEVSGWWCGEGAMVVIAFSTCLNSSHIHLGPSFTLNCFYKRLRARVCVKILSSICIFTKLSECLKAAAGRPS